ncbi:MAG: aminotransferase class V-fold PLP-dependent enzyme [Phycisphaerales bacterium]|nr:MAG: aminotransferase class V-fold PLP-dependent enzyme [Phycisphaerales bacterium]
MPTTTPPSSQAAPTTDIERAVAAMGPGPLRDDALAEHVRPLFSRVLERDEIYLANHSLGRPLDRMANDVRAALDTWYADMDGAWSLWMGEMANYRAQMAKLIDAERADLVVPKATAAQGLRTVLNALPRGRGTRPVRVVTTRGEFDSIDFVLKAYAERGKAEVSWTEADDTGLFHAKDVCAQITNETDLVVISQVYFALGQMLEGVDEIVRTARARGALVLLDTYHCAGAMPVRFRELDADFAIGGNYKYTRGGPGAGWLALHPRHADDPELSPVDTGWFAKREVFAFARTPSPEYAEGGDGWMEATPVILPVFQAKAGLELTNALGPARLRAHNMEQQVFMAECLRERGLAPRLIEPRGAFLLIEAPDLAATLEKLKAAKINADGRPGPDGKRYVRLCPDVLNTRDELTEAAERIARVMP